LRGDYYSDREFVNLALTRIDPVVDFNWTYGSPDPLIPSTFFAVRWSGQVQPLYSQTYTFTTISDDGARLWVNDQLVIDNWAGIGEASGTIALVANQRYNIKMEYREDWGDASAFLLWSSSSQAREIIPTSQLYSSRFSRPNFSEVKSKSLKVHMPSLPLGASSLGLQRAVGSASTPAASLTWTTIASGLASGAVHQDTGLVPSTLYWYRAITNRVSDAAGPAAMITTQPPVAELLSLSLQPFQVGGGGNSSGTVKLTMAAPAGGAVVTLSSDNTLARVPRSVTVPAGKTVASFDISTSAVSAITQVKIRASYEGLSQSKTLVIDLSCSHV
jgi:hypothetical protein